MVGVTVKQNEAGVDEQNNGLLFLVKDVVGTTVFQIDENGVVGWLKGGELVEAESQKDLGLAFAGTILALSADPDTGLEIIDKQEVIGLLEKTLAKLKAQ